MFYCGACATKNEWPDTGFKSRGKCEMCGNLAACNDVPSRRLPPPPPPPVTKWRFKK